MAIEAKFKYYAGVVKDVAEDFGDIVASGLATQGLAMAGAAVEIKKVQDDAQTRIKTRHANRLAHKPA